MSMSRRCDIFKATDEKWYMILGDIEYAEEIEDCTTYGPFSSQEAVLAELDNNHSNPGSFNCDSSGKATPPINPKTITRRRWTSY